MAIEQFSNPEETEKRILMLLSSEEGFQRGFALLVNTYRERLYWHIRGMLGQHDDADDVLQKTFIKVFKGFSGFQGNSKLYTWLYRIATNESLTHIEKTKKQQTAALDDSENGFANSVKAESYMDSEQLDLLLQKAIADLPEKQRQVFLMRYYDELSYQDISEITGTSVGGLKASYHIAAKKIEEYIKQFTDF